jgi:hypothetical protein
MFKKTIQRSEECFIEFTNDELEKLGIKEGDKFSWEAHEEGITLKKFVPLEIDLSEFSRDNLELLIKISAEKDISINDVICDILEQIVCNNDERRNIL